MSMYKYIRQAWKKPKNLEDQKKRILDWKKDVVTKRIEKPTRLDRARSLGYKAKQGYILIRQRVKRGKRQRPMRKHGKRTKHASPRRDLRISYKVIAEQRVEKKYRNCAVLNSYPVGEDANNYWYEVILVDRTHPAIMADPKINWICDKKGRAARGITSAGRHSRALTKKGKGVEKVRPSLRAHNRTAR